MVRCCCHHEESIRESSASGETRQHMGYQCVHVSSHQSIDLGICVPEYELVARGSARDATRRKAAKFQRLFISRHSPGYLTAITEWYTTPSHTHIRYFPLRISSGAF